MLDRIKYFKITFVYLKVIRSHDLNGWHENFSLLSESRFGVTNLKPIFQKRSRCLLTYQMKSKYALLSQKKSIILIKTAKMLKATKNNQQ